MVPRAHLRAHGHGRAVVERGGVLARAAITESPCVLTLEPRTIQTLNRQGLEGRKGKTKGNGKSNKEKTEDTSYELI